MPEVDWREELDRMVDEHIKEYGWHATGVFPTENDPAETPEFVYTAGRSEQGNPELIVVGLSHTVAHGVLSTACGLDELPLGRSGDVLQRLDVFVVEVDPANWSGYLGVATRRHRLVDTEMPFSCRQLVWPDSDGRFPWEDDYNLPAWVQPVLGEVPGA